MNSIIKGGVIMKKININISTETLNWIMTQVDFDNLNPKIAEYLIKWSTNEKTPTFNQIEDVSKATGIPLGYFFLQTPPIENISLVEYRTVDSLALSKPSRNLIDTIHDMDMIQEWVRNHLISENADPIPFIGILKGETDTSKAIQKVRTLLGLDVDWYKKFKTTDDAFRAIRNIISNLGVVVMMNGIVANNTHRSLNINEFRAFATVDEYAPLIFINSNDSINGKLFSLLHEFVHICIGENSLFNDRYSSGEKVKKSETLCNAVAAEILVPQSIFLQEWQNTLVNNNREQTIEILAQNFKCSITVVARRALDNSFIDNKMYENISRLAVELYNDSYQKKKQEKKSSGNFYRTLASRIDKRFLGMLLGSVAEGKTLYTDAFRLTNTNRSTFNTLVQENGGIGI